MSNRLIDGNMEQAGTAAWSEYPGGGITVLTKDPTVKKTGAQSLKVDLNGFTDPQYVDFGQPDALIRSMSYLYNSGSVMPNYAWKNLLPDPGCQKGSAGDWTALNSAILSKPIEPLDAFAPRRLDVAYNGTAGAAAMTAADIFEVGKTYRVLGGAFNNPSIETGNAGSSTVRATGDGNFDFTFSPAVGETRLIVRHTGTTSTEANRIGIYDITAGPSSPVLWADGTVYGSQTKIYSDLGRSIQIQDQNDYVNLGESFFLPGDAQIVYLWINYLRTRSSDGILNSQWDSGDVTRFTFGLENGVAVYRKPGIGLVVKGTTRVDDGRPHLVAWQRKPDAKIEIWIDGQLDNSPGPIDAVVFPSVDTQIGIDPALGGGVSLPCDLSISGGACANWDQIFWEGTYDALRSVALNNGNAYQLISPSTTTPQRVRGWAWSNGWPGSVPVVAAHAPGWADNEIVWFGVDGQPEQEIDLVLPDGVDELVLGVKFSEDGFCNFDDFTVEDDTPGPPSNAIVKMRDVLIGLLPPGEAWKPDIKRDFYKLLDGMGDGADAVYLFLKNLATLRDPAATEQLEDLEKDHGIVPNEGISETIRRNYLKLLRYARNLTGSDDNLENALQTSGFNLKVFRNDPKVDPAILLCEELVVNPDIFDQRPAYEMQCNGAIAFCGNQKAVCGFFRTMERTPKEYVIPDDPDLWGYFFFVCEDRAPAVEANILDGDMEDPGVTNWPAGPNSATAKDTAIKQAGDQSLKVEAVSNTDPQIPVFPQPLAETRTQWWPFTLQGNETEIPSAAWKNLLPDGPMSSPSADHWLPLNGASLAKFLNAPYTGTSQHLRIAPNPTNNPGAYQNVIENGKTYRVIGLGRGGSGGGGVPQVETGPIGSTTVRWTGTSAFTWQPFDFSFTATADGALVLRALTSLISDNAFFVLVGLYDITDGPADPVRAADGTLYGGHYAIQDWGRSIYLDGSAGDYLDTGEKALDAAETQSVYQVFMLVKTTDTDGVFHSQWQAGDPDNYWFGIEGGKLTYERPERGIKLQSAAQINDGLAHQVIWQKRGGLGGNQIHLFIDDLEDTPATVIDNFLFSNTNTRIGIQPGTGLRTAEFTLQAAGVNTGRYFDLFELVTVWGSLRSLRESGSYAQQAIAPPITEQRPVRGYVWADGNGTIPAVYILNSATGQWEALWFGVDKTGRQVFNVETPPGGPNVIRLYSKFVEDGHANFDEVDIRHLEYTRGTVPAELRDRLRRIILQYKPTRSWCCLLVDFV